MPTRRSSAFTWPGLRRSQSAPGRRVAQHLGVALRALLARRRPRERGRAPTNAAMRPSATARSTGRPSTDSSAHSSSAADSARAVAAARGRSVERRRARACCSSATAHASSAQRASRAGRRRPAAGGPIGPEIPVGRERVPRAMPSSSARVAEQVEAASVVGIASSGEIVQLRPHPRRVGAPAAEQQPVHRRDVPARRDPHAGLDERDRGRVRPHHPARPHVAFDGLDDLGVDEPGPAARGQGDAGIGDGHRDQRAPGRCPSRAARRPCPSLAPCHAAATGRGCWPPAATANAPGGRATDTARGETKGGVHVGPRASPAPPRSAKARHRLDRLRRRRDGVVDRGHDDCARVRGRARSRLRRRARTRTGRRVRGIRRVARATLRRHDGAAHRPRRPGRAVRRAGRGARSRSMRRRARSSTPLRWWRRSRSPPPVRRSARSCRRSPTTRANSQRPTRPMGWTEGSAMLLGPALTALCLAFVGSVARDRRVHGVGGRRARSEPRRARRARGRARRRGTRRARRRVPRGAARRGDPISTGRVGRIVVRPRRARHPLRGARSRRARRAQRRRELADAAFGVAADGRCDCPRALEWTWALAPSRRRWRCLRRPARVDCPAWAPRRSRSRSTLVACGVANAVLVVSVRTLSRTESRNCDCCATCSHCRKPRILAMLLLGALLVPLFVATFGARWSGIGVGLIVCVAIAPPARRAMAAADRAADAWLVHTPLLRRGPKRSRRCPRPRSRRSPASPSRAPNAPGAALMCEGDDGDRFYVVVDGSVAVSVRGEQVATLAAGDGVGELGSLHDQPRTATVTAIDDVHALAIDRGDVPRGGHRPPADAATRDRRDRALLRAVTGAPPGPTARRGRSRGR